MKSFFLSLFLALSFGLSIPLIEQPDQISKIVRDLENHIALGAISAGHEILPKMRTLSNPLVGFVTFSLSGVREGEISSPEATLFLSVSNFDSSGASLVYHLAHC